MGEPLGKRDFEKSFRNSNVTYLFNLYNLEIQIFLFAQNSLSFECCSEVIQIISKTLAKFKPNFSQNSSKIPSKFPQSSRQILAIFQQNSEQSNCENCEHPNCEQNASQNSPKIPPEAMRLIH